MKQINKKKNILPDYFAEEVKSIDFSRLKPKLILFDLDATLVEHGSLEVGDEIVDLIAKIDIPVGVATNRLAPKGDNIAKALGAKYVFHATKNFRKPSKQYFSAVLRETNLKPSQIVMVGDRLFSDVYGANRAGLKTVMVRNFGDDPWYIKYFQIRNIEYLLLRLLANHR